MDDLVTFVRARLDEDEAQAQAEAELFGDTWTAVDDGVRGSREFTDVVAEPGAPNEYIARHDPARALREVEAKRRLIELHVLAEEDYGDGFAAERCMVCDPDGNGPFWPCPTLRLLALPYADHPTYREDWRP